MDTPKRLVGPKQLANASATEYTAPALTTTIVKQVILHNSSGAAVTVTFGVGADAAGTRILNAYSIPAGETVILDVWIVLAAAETFRMHASAAASIQATVNGVEVT